ncbi:MAG: glycosyltransferase [Acidobacteria bacterium]|nr:glycosyltransferase [Acidobacteriota bacterium]
MFPYALIPTAATLSEWADLATVTLYFLVIAAMSVHGAHRMSLIRSYLRLRNVAQPQPRDPAEWPRVTVQLPVYNERFVVESLLEAACRLDYPREKLDIQALDDSTDETARIARRAVERLAAAGHPIRYLHRSDRTGYKAGALAVGLAQAKGELIALFDADFSPAPDFLRRIVPHFADPSVGCVQARWEYRNREESLLTRVQGMLLDAHFVVEQVARSRSGLFFNFNGTAGVLRRAAIEQAGGWQHDTLTEDTDLSYRAQMRGWRFVYLPELAVESELPAQVASFQTQQARWAKGLVQTGLKLLPQLWTAELPRRVKIEALLHFSANASYPLMALLAALITPAALIRAEAGSVGMLALDALFFLTTFGSLAAYYLLPRFALRGQLQWRDFALLPAALACGVGLISSNSRGVLEALSGIETPFERTAKLSASSESARLARALYGIRRAWIAWANLLAAALLGLGLFTLVQGQVWPSVPFLTLFLCGFAYSGLLALWQGADRAAYGVSPGIRFRRQPVRESAC